MKKFCLVCGIILLVLIVLGVIGYFALKPVFFKWLCRKGAQEQGAIKMSEDAYYEACLKKYGIEE